MLIVPCAKLNHKTGEDMLQKHIISHPGLHWFVLLNFIASDCVSFWSNCQNNLFIPSSVVLSPIPNWEKNILAPLAAKIKGKEGRKSVVQRQEFILKPGMIKSVVLTNLSSLVIFGDVSSTQYYTAEQVTEINLSLGFSVSKMLVFVHLKQHPPALHYSNSNLNFISSNALY